MSRATYLKPEIAAYPRLVIADTLDAEILIPALYDEIKRMNPMDYYAIAAGEESTDFHAEQREWHSIGWWQSVEAEILLYLLIETLEEYAGDKLYFGMMPNTNSWGFWNDSEWDNIPDW